MSTTSTLLSLAAVGGLAVAGLAFFVKMKAGNREAGADEPASYKQKALLTANELEFLARLEAAVPELRICPQVAMGAVLDPAVSRKQDPKRFFKLRGAFAQKMIDFVAMDRQTGAIVAIIELDDRTHNEDKDAKRDAMLKSAGYKTVRWQSKAKPDAATIRQELLGAR